MDYNRFLLPSRLLGQPYITRKLANKAKTLPHVISVVRGIPDVSTVPVVGATFRLANGSTLNFDADEMITISQYQSSKGNTKTLEWIHKIHAKYHNPPTMEASDRDVRFSAVVTPGCMGAMNLLFRLLVDNNDAVLTDELDFGGTRKNIEVCGGTLVGIKMDEHGMLPDNLRDTLARWQQRADVTPEQKLRKPRLLYTVPTGHNPTGITTALERKMEIYKIAQEHDLLIVEDDPYYYLQYSEEYVPSYQSIDTDGRVVRMDSLSKLIAPGYRIGWVTGPDAIIREVFKSQMICSVSVSSLSEALVVKLFEHWGMDGFQRYVDGLTSHYREMRDKTEGFMKKFLTGLVEWDTPQAGIYFWPRLKGGLDSMFFADAELCERHGVFAVPGIDFACDPDKICPRFRVCFTCTDRLEEAIKRLASLIKEQMENGRHGIFNQLTSM